MKQNSNSFPKLIVALGLILVAPIACAQNNSSSDRLLDLLIKKGVLTDAESKQVKAEADRGAVDSGSKWKLSPYINNIELYGDFRGRYQESTAENQAYIDRTRYP